MHGVLRGVRDLETRKWGGKALNALALPVEKTLVYIKISREKCNNSSSSLPPPQYISFLLVRWLLWDWNFQDFSGARYFSFMVQSHILASAAVTQKTEQFGLVERTYPIESKLQNCLTYVIFDPSAELYLHVVYSPLLEEMALSLSSTMSWLCSCILFSIFLDYIFLCTIMLKILWTWDRGKCLSFLNILAYYCQFIMSHSILWWDDEDQTLLVRVIWQTSAKLLSLGWQQLVVEKAFESSISKRKGVKEDIPCQGKLWNKSLCRLCWLKWRVDLLFCLCLFFFPPPVLNPRFLSFVSVLPFSDEHK